MFPLAFTLPTLFSYELFLHPSTTSTLFDVIPPDQVRVLRLSGSCRLLDKAHDMPALRHLTIKGVTGTYLDQHFQELFSQSQLSSFQYAHSYRLGFEITDQMLSHLVAGPAAGLRKLVLLQCSRLSSAALTACLQELPLLEYLALSIITFDELQSNFVAVLPSTICVLKLRVSNIWYKSARIVEETRLCESLEAGILRRRPPPHAVFLSFREEIMNTGRVERWEDIARAACFTLKLGLWEDQENI